MTSAPSAAEQIGIDQIRTVVDQFYDKVQRHPTLSAPFSVVADWPEHKDHLTYFWWLTLGGERYREIAFSVVLKHARAGFSKALLEDRKVLFAAVIREQVPQPLARTWLEEVERLGASLLLANDLHLSRRSTQ